MRQKCVSIFCLPLHSHALIFLRPVAAVYTNIQSMDVNGGLIESKLLDKCENLIESSSEPLSTLFTV
jgi:hypothetical protein